MLGEPDLRRLSSAASYKSVPNDIRGIIIRPVPGKPIVYTRVGMFEHPWGKHSTDEDHI